VLRVRLKQSLCRFAVCHILQAANYLDVKNLLDFLLSHVATLIVACKDAKEIREKFSITDDLPANEVEDIKKKHTWAFRVAAE